VGVPVRFAASDPQRQGRGRVSFEADVVNKENNTEGRIVPEPGVDGAAPGSQAAGSTEHGVMFGGSAATLRVRIASTKTLSAEDHKINVRKKNRVLGRQCVQTRQTCSVGISPTRVRVRSPVARVAFVEETKRMKPTDKAIFGMVSESPGRNASEPSGGLDKK